MTIAQEIKQKLELSLPRANVEVLDESASHIEHNPTGAHISITISYPGFVGKNKVEQHQMVYGILKEEMKGKIHALKINILEG
jgi:BolA family transcriptional regulator, general stress-responsive regulator